VIVGAREPAQIAAIADAVAGQEKASVGRLRLRRPYGEHENGGKRKQCDAGSLFHWILPVFVDAPLLTRRRDHYSAQAAAR
jgi:hypothetical protein